MNQILTYLANTKDARTFNAWKALDRSPKKGSKAFYIWKPVSLMIREVKPKYRNVPKEQLKPDMYQIAFSPFGSKLESYQQVIKPIFGLQAEFRSEDMTGEMPKPNNEPKELPPLVTIAKRLGVKVSWAKYDNRERGSFSSGLLEKKITLKVYDWKTFFHELTHAIHEYINLKEFKVGLKNGQDNDQENIAEFTACVIADLYGIDTKQQTLRYIAGYTETGTKEEAIKRIYKNMDVIGKVLDFIFEEESETVTKKGAKN